MLGSCSIILLHLYYRLLLLQVFCREIETGKNKNRKEKKKKEENKAPDISAFSIFSNNQHHYKIGNFLSQNSEYRIFTIAQRQIIGAGELSVLKGTAIQGRFFWPFDAFFWYRLRAQFLLRNRHSRC